MDKLVKAAMEARKKAYAPYSKFKVGAAVETAGGRIFTGCNLENSSFGLTVCAERNAIAKAVSEGYRKFRRIAIVTSASNLTSPCGACRQVLFEFSPGISIILADTKGRTRETDLARLLPDAFSF